MKDYEHDTLYTKTTFPIRIFCGLCGDPLTEIKELPSGQIDIICKRCKV